MSVCMSGVHSASTSAGNRPGDPGAFPLATRPVCYEAAAEDRRDFLVFGSFAWVWAALMAATWAWSTFSW